MASVATLAPDRTQLLRLRTTSLLEGATLLLLVFVAVPAKHFFGFPLATKLMGPVHGLAFLAFLWSLLAAASAGGWRRGEIVRLLIGSCVPFGAFVNIGLLRRKEATAV